jgi:hypothetical protein
MTCVIRKELNSANFASPNDIDKIIDRVVRERISALILQRGGDFKKAVDQGGFTMASGVPIKKVRVKAHVKNPKILRLHAATVLVHRELDKRPVLLRDSGHIPSLRLL